MDRKLWIKTMVILALSLSGCGSHTHSDLIGGAGEEVSRDLFAMDTYMSVTAYGAEAEEAVEKAVEEIVRLDELLSTGDADSEVALVNENGGGVLSTDTRYLLELSMALYQDTEGMFDIAVYPVMEAWGFTSGEYRVPSEQEIAQLLPLTDISGINFDSETSGLTFEVDGMKIDFGGIAKGYTSSRIKEIFEEHHVACGLINLGGNVHVLGKKPDGSLWNVAIQSPHEADGMLGVVSIQDKAVITSGGYERYFEEDGISYHHIIDPRTGYPAENGLESVTIVSEDGALADGLSTSLFVMGKEKAIDYWKTHSDDFDAILLTDEDELCVTEGLADHFTSDEAFEVIKKD